MLAPKGLKVVKEFVEVEMAKGATLLNAHLQLVRSPCRGQKIGLLRGGV
jgi:hypothetical protein